MRLNTKILIPWALFSVVLLGGLLLFERQLTLLRHELINHISVHQQAVQIARDLRYLSLQRLALAQQVDAGAIERLIDQLLESENLTKHLIITLDGLLASHIHQRTLEGGDQGRGILASYALARQALPEFYRAWLEARLRPNNPDEPLRHLQLMQQYNVVDALLEDLSQYQEITQQLVIERSDAQIRRTQLYFYSFILAVLLSVIAFARYQGLGIATPLRKLSESAQAVAFDNSLRFDEVRTSVREINTLNGAITSMVGKLQGYLELLSRRQDEILGQMARLAQIGGWEFDLDHRRLIWTEEVYRIHEVEMDSEPRLEEAIHFYAPEAQPLIQAALDKAMAEGVPWDLELPFITAKGRHLWVRTLGQPVLRQGRVVRLNGAFQDITEQRRTLEMIRQANADLEGFSYSVSHDLRAPLRAIDGFIEILLEEHASRLDEEGRRMFGVVQENARKMGQLIDDILAFSRAGRLELDWQTVEMKALVREVWEDLAEQRAGREVELELDELPSVWGDPRALRQICANLLANAIKFTRDRQPGRVWFSAECSHDWAHFLVRDNGVGFDPAYTSKLFVLFQRLHGMDEFEGTGVGLAIVKRFIQKHGGQVEASAVPDGGAAFSFTLPMHAGARGATFDDGRGQDALPPLPHSF